MDILKNKAVALLRWSERYTKTDMVYLASAGGWLSVGYFVSSVVAFLMAIAFANLIEKEAYGTYRFVLSAGILIGALSLTGLKTSLIQAVASGFDDTLRHAFKERLLWSIPMFGVALATSGYYVLTGNTILSLSLLVVALCNPLLYSSTLYAAYLNGKERFKTAALYSIARSIIPALFLFVALFLFKDNALSLVIVYFVTHTTLAFFFYRRTARQVSPGAKVDTASNTYGKHLSVLNLLDTAATQIDKILVFHFVGASGLAIYFFALNIPEQIGGLFSNIYPIALPKFAKRPLHELRPWLPRKMLRFGILLALVVIAYILIAPWLFTTFFPQYTESIFLSQILSLSILALVGLLPTAVLHAKKASKILAVVRGIVSVFRIGIIFALVIPFGLPGVVAASLLGKLVEAICTSYAIRYLKEPAGV